MKRNYHMKLVPVTDISILVKATHPQLHSSFETLPKNWLSEQRLRIVHRVNYGKETFDKVNKVEIFSRIQYFVV